MKTSLIKLFACILMLHSCSKDDKDEQNPEVKALQADFDVKQYHSDIDDFLFEFINTSKNAIRYEWSFGDGEESDQFEPTHIYKDYGLYVVKMDAFDGQNLVSSKSATVTYGPHIFTRLVIDSAITVVSNYIDTFHSHDFNLINPISSRAFNMKLEEMFPLELDVYDRSFDLSPGNPKFFIQLRHEFTNGFSDCGNYINNNDIMQEIYTTEKMIHNLEFEFLELSPCETQLFSKIYARFEIAVKE